MNICIVTVYNTENCGSFWQARALADVLTNLGHNVSFLYRSTEDTSLSFKAHLRHSLAKAAKLDFRAAMLVWKKSANYKIAQKYFDVIFEDSDRFKEIDCFVLGSDTIWNFSSSYFMKHKNKYTGANFLPKKSITYAASAANTTYEIFEADKEIKNSITKLYAISVRDEETGQIVEKLTGRKATVVCDPTMLTEKNFFDKNTREIQDNNYILIYHFDDIPDNVKVQILNLKKTYGCKIISFGAYRSWCDKTITNNPYDFLSYFKNASFVITDTFHGTIFSILYEKKFAEYGNHKKKISDLLSLLHLTSTVAEDGKNLEEIYAQKLDYTFTNEKIKSLRQESLLYLKENLSEN